MKKEKLIGLVIAAVAALISLLVFLFGEGILRDHDNDTQQIDTKVSSDNTTIPAVTSFETTRDNSDHNDSSSIKENNLQDTPVVVPNLIGMEQNEAADLLTFLGLEYKVWWEEENDVSSEYYYIVGQSIPEKTSVEEGTLIALEISAVKP